MKNNSTNVINRMEKRRKASDRIVQFISLLATFMGAFLVFSDLFEGVIDKYILPIIEGAYSNFSSDTKSSQLLLVVLNSAIGAVIGFFSSMLLRKSFKKKDEEKEKLYEATLSDLKGRYQKLEKKNSNLHYQN